MPKDEPEKETEDQILAGKGWKIESLNITKAENGYSLRVQKQRKSKKTGDAAVAESSFNTSPSYNTSTFVFTDVDELVEKVRSVLGDVAEND